MDIDRTLAVRLTLAALSLGAAAVHFAMAPQHAGESVLLGTGFVVAAWAQVVVAGLLIARPGRTVLAGGALVQVAVCGVWALSRTAGLPVGAQHWQPEPVGLADGVTVALQVAFVVLALAALTSRRRLPVVSGVVAAALIMGGTTAALASPSVREHQHGAEASTVHVHGTDAGAGGATAAGHVHPGGSEGTSPAGTVPPAGTGGLDGAGAHAHLVTSDAPPTADQIARAAALIDATKRSLPKWADPRAAEADGFRAIQGPGAGFVHFVNFAWMTDPTVLDPEHPESLVYRSTDGTKSGYRLESAMYILPSLDTPIPDVGGSLTPWHNHGDLCFGAGTMIVGTTAAGACPPGSSNVKTPDMLHVWIVDHPDGPFGGIEGSG